MKPVTRPIPTSADKPPTRPVPTSADKPSTRPVPTTGKQPTRPATTSSEKPPTRPATTSSEKPPTKPITKPVAPSTSPPPRGPVTQRPPITAQPATELAPPRQPAAQPPAPKPAPPPSPHRAAAAAPGEDPMVGTVIEDRYRLERLLGAGGMSRVYLGTHLRVGGKLAIKLVDLRLSNKPDMIQRCLQEARTMMEIQSNYVVRASDCGVLPSGQLFIVMEHLAGEDLEHLVQREGPLPWARAAEMAIQICSGLSAAHKRGTIHRDIKPQNCIRVTLDGNPDHIKLIDFGIARDANAEVGLTQDGMILGTPEYMAPELVIAGTAPDGRTDIYALGALLYKLLTGLPPFRGRDALDTLYQTRNSPVIPPSEAAPKLDIPAEADAIVLKALAKSPADRYSTADEMAKAIRASLGLMRSGINVMPESTGPVNPRVTSSPGSSPSSPGIARPSTQPVAFNEASSPGRLAPGQEVETSEMRPVTTRDIVMRGVTLLSMSLFFGVASWLAAPHQPPTPTIAVANKPATDKPAVAEPVAEKPVDPPVADKPVDPPVADPPVVEPVADKPVDPPVADPPVADPPVVEPVADKPVDPPVVDPPVVDKPIDPPVADKPVDAPTPEPPIVDPPADAPADPAAGVIEPNFDYKSAKKYVDEQRDYVLNICLAKAEKPTSKLTVRFDVRASGRPAVQIISPSKAVRDCARPVLSFQFDPSPRGGAFSYTLAKSGGSFVRQPLDPKYAK